MGNGNKKYLNRSISSSKCSILGQYHDVSEDTHWTPFLEAAVKYIRDTYPPPWTEVIRHVGRRPLLELLSWYPVIWSSLCSSTEDRAPVDEIYGCPIFKWVTVTWLNNITGSVIVPVMVTSLVQFTNGETWWRQPMESFSVLLDFCDWNPPVVSPHIG